MAARSLRTATDVLRKTIAERAYTIWESEGRLHGADVEHWLRAEAEVAASMAHHKSNRIRKSASAKPAKPAKR
jgi:hypothetical protein